MILLDPTFPQEGNASMFSVSFVIIIIIIIIIMSSIIILNRSIHRTPKSHGLSAGGTKDKVLGHRRVDQHLQNHFHYLTPKNSSAAKIDNKGRAIVRKSREPSAASAAPVTEVSFSVLQTMRTFQF